MTIDSSEASLNGQYGVSGQLNLSAIKQDWYAGEWQSLISLELTSVAQSPDRAAVTLLIASAHLQLGNNQKGRHLVQQSIEWGCSPRSIAKVLTAGVHNTLARVSALRGNKDLIDKHFQSAVEGVDESGTDFVHTRSAREMTRLGLLDQASAVISCQLEEVGQRQTVESKIKMLAEIRSSQLAVRQALEAKGHLAKESENNEPGKRHVNIPEAYAAGERLVILVAGMRHSGSTALFNALRLGIESLGIPFHSGYTENFDVEDAQRQQKGIFLLKTHEYRDDVAELADFVFTTKRDLRDTVASAVRRKFPLCERLNPLEYSKYNRQLWEIWRHASDYEFKYERYMEYPVAELEEVLGSIGLEQSNAALIHREITRLPTDQYKVTLLSPTHITDPERKFSYHDTLEADQLAFINRNNIRWLELNGYE